jgi:hypothetical protein
MNLEDVQKKLAARAVLKNPKAKPMNRKWVVKLGIPKGAKHLDLEMPVLAAAIRDILSKGWMIRTGLHTLSPADRVVLAMLQGMELCDVPGDEIVGNTRVQCYVSPGDGPDRWTVVYPDQPETKPKTFACVGMSGHSSAMLGRHLGKRVKLAELPESLQGVVRADCAA